jgi:hypothetical protein
MNVMSFILNGNQLEIRKYWQKAKFKCVLKLGF